MIYFLVFLNKAFYLTFEFLIFSILDINQFMIITYRIFDLNLLTRLIKQGKVDILN